MPLVTAVGAGGAGTLSPGRAALKVIQAAGWYFPDSLGGTEIYVAAIARRFRQAGIETLIAAPRAGVAGVDQYRHDEAPVFRYGIPAAPTRAEARGEKIVRGAEAFHRWLGEQRPDVVHFHTFVTGLDLAEVEAAKRTGARVFVTTHSSALGYLCLRGTLMRWGTDLCDGVIRRRTCSACALQARGISRPIAKLASLIPAAVASPFDRLDHPLGTALGLPAYIGRRQIRQRQLLDTVERFFVLTEWARQAMLANGAPPTKVTVNRLGIDAEAIGATRRSVRGTGDPLVIGFLGRVDPVKGIDDLLVAIQLLPASLPVQFEIRAIADQSASAAIVNRMRAAAAADPRIRVGGPAAREEIESLLGSWDVLCCPGKSLEGGPTVALEAMAVGTPVIATAIGGVAELLTDGVNGALLAPGDPQALADAIRGLVDRPQVLEAWRAALPPIRTMDDVARDYLLEYAA